MAKTGKGRGRKLDEYRAKRSADRTPEPFTGVPGSARMFVVQMHAARNLHYDLRLETGGVLKSWAVPKGPSFDPQVKRLAVHVEDHPVEYAAFEGKIPEGNYGAGAVIVWDRGLWVPLEDLEQGWQKGKLLFELRGYKLKGVWTLFKTKGGDGRQWLLMKKPDAWADPEAEPAPESILSGLTVQQLLEGHDPAKTLRARLKRSGAPRKAVAPERVAVMLAKTRETPFSNPAWVFEIKYDGFRMIAARRDGEAYLRWRRGQETTSSFPEIAGAVAALPYKGLVLDGEVVVLDEEGKPSFQRLQQRFQLSRPADIRRSSVNLPATYFAFDLLAAEGFDLRPLPLVERKKMLQGLIPPGGPLRYSDHFEERGEAVFEQIEAMQLEGIVAKRADAPYRGARSEDWLKIRSDRTGDFVIVGYSPPKRARSGFGALHLAFCEDDRFVYAGRVGTGFSEKQLKELQADLDAIRRPEPAVEGNLPKSEGHTWVDPEMVCEVRYKQWTRAGQLRHPVFLGLRDDKPVEDCIRPGSDREAPTAAPDPAPPVAEERVVRFTNLDKVFWPEEGYTKGDLIDYYRSVGDWILPYLEDRPVVLTRYPDGIDGKSFFQKDAPAFVPEWVRIETMWSEHAEREIRYFICDNVETLVLLANLGTIPLHIWSSRVCRQGRPGGAQAVPRDRDRVLLQDQRVDRAAHPAAAGRAAHLRTVAQPGRDPRPCPGDEAARDRDHDPRGSVARG
jgi:bifunctional non-homologous end joining protein LigD